MAHIGMIVAARGEAVPGTEGAEAVPAAGMVVEANPLVVRVGAML